MLEPVNDRRLRDAYTRAHDERARVVRAAWRWLWARGR